MSRPPLGGTWVSGPTRHTRHLADPTSPESFGASPRRPPLGGTRTSLPRATIQGELTRDSPTGRLGSSRIQSAPGSRIASAGAGLKGCPSESPLTATTARQGRAYGKLSRLETEERSSPWKQTDARFYWDGQRGELLRRTR